MSKDKKPPAILSVILFISRPTIKNSLKQILREHGVIEFLQPSNVEECILMLQEKHATPFIVDFEQGDVEINRLLAAAQSPEQASIREIYLIASEAKNEVVIIAAEYNVSRVHVGEISKTQITSDLLAIASRHHTTERFKDTLRTVAELRKTGDHLEAKNRLRDALVNDESNVRLKLELADSLTFNDEWDEAAQISEEILIEDGANLRAMHILARCKMKFGDSASAIKLLEHASAFNKLKMDRLLDFGEILLETGKYKEALVKFEMASSLDSESKAAIEGQGKCKLLIGEVNDALELLNESCDGHEIAGIFNAVAIIAIKNGEFDRGLKLYKVALTSVANSNRLKARLQFNMGLAFYKAGRHKEALSCFVTATDLDPSFDSAAKNARAVTSLLDAKGPLAGTSTHEQTQKTTDKKDGRKSAFQGSITDFIDEFDKNFEEEKNLY